MQFNDKKKTESLLIDEWSERLNVIQAEWKIKNWTEWDIRNLSSTTERLLISVCIIYLQKGEVRCKVKAQHPSKATKVVTTPFPEPVNTKTNG